MSNGRCLASLDRLSQDQVRSARAAATLDWQCGTGIWPSRDIVADRRHVASLYLSPPTAPPPTARTPARKAGILDRGALFAARDGLSAGGGVTSEPVSEAKFPASWEITGNFAELCSRHTYANAICFPSSFGGRLDPGCLQKRRRDVAVRAGSAAILDLACPFGGR